MGKAGSVAVILVLILLPVINIISFLGVAGPLTQVTMDPEYQEIEVDVAPDSMGDVSTTINVTCQTAMPVPVMVSLSTTFQGGVVSLSPVGLIFQSPGTETREVTVDIMIPIGTKSSELHCIIVGTWSQGANSGSVDPVTIQVNVMPFYLPDIFCESPEKEVNKGESVTFELRINNSGNTDDIYHIEIANSEDLISKGITVNEISDVPIVYQGYDVVEVKVQVSSDTEVKGANIDVVVTSTLDDEQEEFTYQLNIEIKEGPFSLDFFTSPLVIVIIIIVIILVIIVYVRKRK
jgi:uncharacterized membrane protein